MFHNLILHSYLTRKVAIASLALPLFCAAAASMFAQTPTPVAVPTWRYDLTHSGENTDETALTPANVNVNSFGKLFSQKVDGNVYAQPLYVPALTMSDGQVHNVLFVATENDSLYAFDADSNGGEDAQPLWKVTLLDAAHGAGPGATPQLPQSTGENDIGPVIGITGTPVIDPTTNTMYVVGATEESGAYFIRLHAINILTGAERTNSPVTITATVSGTGNGSAGGKLSFSPLWENQRPALNYYNGHVYIGFAAHGDLGPWHGWLFAYNGASLAQTAALCLSPNGYGAGIWAAGAGMPIDDGAAGGRMFVSTGNGTETSYPPITASTGLGESIIDFSLANGGLEATDAFTSFNNSKLDTSDEDLGSGGVLMLPDQQGDNTHILVQAGKEGRIVVLNRDDLGGYAPGGTSNTNALQDIPGQVEGLWSTPAYWNGNVYFWAEKDVPKAFKLNDGVLGTEPFTQSSVTSNFPGASFTISSNGTQDGIAWAVRSDQVKTNGPNVLYAWDANDLTNTIYESDTNPQRDAAGLANRFTIPVVTNGKVYVSSNKEVSVYGLLNGELTAAAPMISPDGGTFSASQSVTLSSTTALAEIYYTLNRATPTPSSTLYSHPFTIDTNTTVKAMASATGYLQSGVSSATFTFGTGASCSAPTSAGVHLCLPLAGSTVNSPVQVSANSTVTGTLASTQLWVDGVKKYGTASAALNTSISLAGGSHRFAVLAINTAGQKWETAVNSIVGNVGACSAPTSAGVHICLPASGSTIGSPVQVTASSTVNGTIARSELWVDGMKKYAVAGAVFNTSISLTAGSHRIAVLAINTVGQKWESAVYATVN